jgi:predicted Rossmann fold nucleotide-binding protein DprA/Smf involved in DNA uptake
MTRPARPHPTRSLSAATLVPGQPGWPHRLTARLGAEAPAVLHAFGNTALLQTPLLALFCSARCPGEAILRAYDEASHWRDTGRGVISGFHSPMENECLRILLRGPQPVVICPAHGLPLRLPPVWREPLATGRLLIVTPFGAAVRRATREFADLRNLLVAALADELWFAHVTPGGQMARLAQRAGRWGATLPAAVATPNVRTA